MCGSAPVFEKATTWPTLAVIVGRVELEVLDRDGDRPGVLGLAARPGGGGPAAVAAEAATAGPAAAAGAAAGDDALDEQAASTRPGRR